MYFQRHVRPTPYVLLDKSPTFCKIVDCFVNLCCILIQISTIRAITENIPSYTTKSSVTVHCDWQLSTVCFNAFDPFSLIQQCLDSGQYL